MCPILQALLWTLTWEGGVASGRQLISQELRSTLNGILLFGGPVAGRVDCFSKLKRHVLRVINDMPKGQHGGRPSETKVSQFVG
jgi:hypothetical protein